MTGLDHVEQVFAQQIHEGAGDTEAEQSTPHAATGRIAGDGADAITDTGTGSGYDHEGDGNGEVDEEAKDQKGGSLGQQANNVSNIEVFHERSVPVLLTGFLRVSCSVTFCRRDTIVARLTGLVSLARERAVWRRRRANWPEIYREARLIPEAPDSSQFLTRVASATGEWRLPDFRNTITAGRLPTSACITRQRPASLM